jgi:hypothetical protein
MRECYSELRFSLNGAAAVAQFHKRRRTTQSAILSFSE